MKIIQPGQLPSEKLYRATCYHCYAVIEFQQDEAVPNSMGEYEITCPTKGCGISLIGQEVKEPNAENWYNK